MKIELAQPQSIRGQLTVLLLLALIVVQCLNISLFIEERRASILAALAKDGASRAMTVANALNASAEEPHRVILRSAESIDFRLSIDDAAFSSLVTGEQPEFLRSAVDTGLGPAPGRAASVALIRDVAALPKRSPSHIDPDGDPMELVVSVPLRDGRWLNARIDTGGPPLQWAWPALVSILLISAAVVAVVWMLVGRISRPLRLLAEKAERLGRGEATQPLASSGPAEVRRLTKTFEDMEHRLMKLLAERSTMLAALGHDLRSPITAMRIRLEMVDEDETRERLRNCLDEMQSLVQSALALARGADTTEPVVPVNLGQMVRQLAGELRESGGDASVSVSEEFTVHAREVSLKRAVRNIADNAIRYGGEARISLQRSENAALIIVEDNGPGIPFHERERIFEPFVRLEASRSRATGGSGLGLAIARAVIESNGGSVTAEDPCHLGARFVIRIPVMRPTSRCATESSV